MCGHMREMYGSLIGYYWVLSRKKYSKQRTCVCPNTFKFLSAKETYTYTRETISLESRIAISLQIKLENFAYQISMKAVWL